jgi:hypothetical protein
MCKADNAALTPVKAGPGGTRTHSSHKGGAVAQETAPAKEKVKEKALAKAKAK